MAKWEGKLREEGIDRRKEVPYNPQEPELWDQTATRRPYSALQALMETSPGQEPAVSQEEMLALREVLEDAITNWLDPEELEVFNAFYVERLTLREIENRTGIPKTSVARIRDKARQRLENVLVNHPIIRERNMAVAPRGTWEAGAYAAAAEILEAYKSPVYAEWIWNDDLGGPVEKIGEALEVIRARVFDNETLDPEFQDELDDGSVRAIYKSLAVEALRAPHVDPERVTGHLKRVVDLIARKQHDYGHDNIARFGNYGLVIRMHDKQARIVNLSATQSEAQNEPITDSWDDVLGYSIIGIMWEDQTFMLPLERDLNASE